MAKILNYLRLMRVRQWYKNLVIFLAIFFAGRFFNVDELYLTFLGFLSLSFISSMNYIVNDFTDLKKDRSHPEKKDRPLASGEVGSFSAVFLILVLAIAGFLMAWNLGNLFFYSILSFFVLAQLYNFIFRNVVFADILVIACLFVIRALSGVFVINLEEVSPWLILCPFFLSLFLSIGKRHSDLYLLKENASKTRKVLSVYNFELTSPLMVIVTTLLISSYALYSFMSDYQNLIYTLPFALFVVFRYFYLINIGSVIARHPEKVIKDKQMLIGILLWVLVTGVLIYI